MCSLDQRGLKGFPSPESCVSNRIMPELKDRTIYNLGHSLALKFASTNDPFLYKPELENNKETCNYSQMESFVQIIKGEATFERTLWICFWANDGIKRFFFFSSPEALDKAEVIFLFESKIIQHLPIVCGGVSMPEHIGLHEISANPLREFGKSTCYQVTTRRSSRERWI